MVGVLVAMDLLQLRCTVYERLHHRDVIVDRVVGFGIQWPARHSPTARSHFWPYVVGHTPDFPRLIHLSVNGLAKSGLAPRSRRDECPRAHSLERIVLRILVLG